ncbi:MAG: bifunctional phosphoribosylaminoimidazolecarboxamide formyltransferase/IMP cyclohydrolase [Treponema sp.]|jgi:phosphoribosylaminoimidazolecarboxamide formyltransferase/IMP cyclohydrolase|nr:bifunctional phosphoribosylaminoimidazolecarboxamide formyltransferase/IMP cyclohydrolase [Treponema sp.]
MKKRALISVFCKDGILDLASFLSESGWEILSTGGTAAHLKAHHIPVTDVASVTGFPECLDGRVKTLHPAIHAGLLARRSEASHRETLEKLGIAPIDLVCVNLYPFFEKARAGLSPEETIEFIDIGGPSMLRSAAKNYRDVIVLSDPADYDETMADLRAGTVPESRRKALAVKVFELTAAYDGAIARYLLDEPYPRYWSQPLVRARALRYGENSHQPAALYLNVDEGGALPAMEQIHGKELSYNNIRDLDLAWKAACAFGLAPDHRAPLGEADLEGLGIAGHGPAAPAAPPACCAAVKHNTPCGIALGATLLEAYERAYYCDPLSIFGGIVASTVPVDAATAKKLAGLFLEIIVAPAFDDEALDILRGKKNLRLMKAPRAPREKTECIAVDGGLLVQEADRKLLEKWEVPTRAAPADEDLEDLIFGLRAAAYVKSNAIVVVKDRSAVGIGGGQTNRIWAAEQALARGAGAVKAMAEAGLGDGKPPRTLASDAFFPFPDVVEAAAAAGIKAIIQPGGSINDKLSIEACDKLGIAMVLTGTRHFKH